MTRRLLFALPFLHFGVGRMAIELATARLLNTTDAADEL